MYKLKQYCSFCNKATLHYKINLIMKQKSNEYDCNFKIIKHDIINLKIQNKQSIFVCSECKKYSLDNNYKNIDLPNPYNKMDNDLKEMYNEARLIFNYSLRGALGILRCIFENLLIRKFNIKNPTKISEILKNQQVNKSLGKNIIDSANNFKNICNIALHSSEMDQESIKNEIYTYFDWINKLSWVISDSNTIVDKNKITQQINTRLDNSINKSKEITNLKENDKNKKKFNNKQINNSKNIANNINNISTNETKEHLKDTNNLNTSINKAKTNSGKKKRNKKWNNKNKQNKVIDNNLVLSK
ncbi:MAG: hypothetical protein K2I36_03240 [Ureaplasma sp.]|nr:hypothetical protein [Ureaplasma sp.]